MKLSKSKLTIAGAALLTALMLPAVSGAQNASTRADASRQPVQYGADSGEYTPDGFSLRGRAEVTQGGNRLRADAIRGFTSNGDLNRIEASGDRAVYTLNDGNVVVTGDVILTQGKSVLTGSRLVYNVRTETARIEGGGGNGRVQGVFYPQGN